MDTEPYPVAAGLLIRNFVTEGGHVVDSVSRIRSGYEYGRSPRKYSYGKRSHGKFHIPNTYSDYEYG